MPTAPLPRRRNSLRLQEYDYSQPGAYFVTIVTQGRENLFGSIIDGKMRTNAPGQMIEHWWHELIHKFPLIVPDEHIVMPNHFHGVIQILPGESVGSDLCVCPDMVNCPGMVNAKTGASLPDAVRWFKTMTTNEYVRGVKHLGWTPFSGKLWQRSYHDHIIRNDKEWDLIREYILNNPELWEQDQEYSTHNL